MRKRTSYDDNNSWDVGSSSGYSSGTDFYFNDNRNSGWDDSWNTGSSASGNQSRGYSGGYGTDLGSDPWRTDTCSGNGRSRRKRSSDMSLIWDNMPKIIFGLVIILALLLLIQFLSKTGVVSAFIASVANFFSKIFSALIAAGVLYGVAYFGFKVRIGGNRKIVYFLALWILSAIFLFVQELQQMCMVIIFVMLWAPTAISKLLR